MAKSPIYSDKVKKKGTKIGLIISDKDDQEKHRPLTNSADNNYQ